MKVLDLFSGTGCWYHGIREAGFDVEKYYAVETELVKNSRGIIVPSQNQWPRQVADATIPNLSRPCDMVEDFTAATAAKIGHIDMVVASPPCQPFSQAGAKKGLSDERGGYYLIVAAIIAMVNPTYFIIENVAPSKDSGALEAFARAFGVEGVKFNSENYGAQHRERMFWTSAAVNAHKEPNGMTVGDIMLPPDHPSVMAMKRYIWTPVKPYGNSVKVIGTIGKIGERSTTGFKVPSSNGVYDVSGKMPTLLGKTHGSDACQGVVLDKPWKGGSQSQRVNDAKGKSTAQTCGHRGGAMTGLYADRPAQAERVYDPKGKGQTQSCGGGGGARTGLYADRPPFGDRQSEKIFSCKTKGTALTACRTERVLYPAENQTARPLTVEECAALQWLPPNLIPAARIALPKMRNSPIYKFIGNGLDIKVIADIIRQVINGTRGQGRL